MGGVITICLYMYVIFQTSQNFIKFLEKDEPVVQSYKIIDIDDIDQPQNFMDLKGGVFIEIENSFDENATFPYS